MTFESPDLKTADRFIHGPGLAASLQALSESDPDRVYMRSRNATVTARELNERVVETADILRERGVRPGSRVALALEVSVEHITLVFALMRVGAVWVPTNTQLKGAPLEHHLNNSKASSLITDAHSSLSDNLPASIPRRELLLSSEAESAIVEIDTTGLHEQHRGAERGDLAGVCLIMYTSGTTGPPKGTMVTETMIRAAILGALEVTRPEPGDVYYVWEPLFHIGGAQVIFLPLFSSASLAIVPRFSASRFWTDIVDFDVTHIHYLGGVLQILAQLPPTPEERDNRVRIAWGAGATPEVRAACEDRFRFALHECYGMTEVSSIVTVNRDDPSAGVGAPFPWVEIATRGGENRDTSGSAGEILVRGRVDGMITPGYLDNPEATASSRDETWFKTGDLGRIRNEKLHFEGRNSDSIRVRGENVSAWQVESVFSLHPDIDRCAIVGVSADVGEEEMLLIVTELEGKRLSPAELIGWGQDRLARFQVPRYVKTIEGMPLTPSQRISKHQLSRDLDGSYDSHRKTDSEHLAADPGLDGRS